VLIGSGAVFIASKSEIIIGNKVLFGPKVTLVAGDHTVDRVGVFIYDITDETKDEKDDADIVIEDDVWIGANVTVLKGVTIGRGCVVGAGSVVIKSINPYSVVVGVPAREVKRRFTIEEIFLHEKSLYPEDLRYSAAQLVSFESTLRSNQHS
jgi:acetyltransferase-like isoleucine patch superfamily enzyme